MWSYEMGRGINTLLYYGDAEGGAERNERGDAAERGTHGGPVRSRAPVIHPLSAFKRQGPPQPLILGPIQNHEGSPPCETLLLLSRRLHTRLSPARGALFVVLAGIPPPPRLSPRQPRDGEPADGKEESGLSDSNYKTY